VLSVWLFSHWLVFAGILHHDILAGGYLVIALFCSEKNLRAFGGNHIVYGIGAGFFAGVTLLTSMLPALIVFALAVYIVMSWRLKPIVLFGIGCLLGLLPLTVYNFYYFGNPLIQANVAGNYADTFFNFNFEQFIFRVNAYIGYGGLSIWKYAPLLGLGFGGILVLPKSLRMVKVFVLAAITLHLFYLFNIETLGTCQYGPRYLLPLLPFLAIGVAELMQRASRLPAFFTGGFFGIAAAYSFWVSMVGAVGGAMQCDLRNFTFVKYLASSSRLSWGNLPLFWPLFVLFLLLLVCLIVTNRKHLQAYFCTQSRLQ